MSGVHGEVIPYKLSAEELARYDAELGKPTKPLNYYKGRVYSKPPKEEPKPKVNQIKSCSKRGCTNKHYSRGYCASHYNKMKRMGLL